MYSLAMGMHATMLQHWFEFFEPRQFVLVSSDYYYSQPLEVLKELFAHLDLPAPEASHGYDKNRRQHPPMPSPNESRIIEDVRSFYQPHVAKLRTLLAGFTG